MAIAECCTRDVVVAERKDSVLHAAKLMRLHHVGTVVVVDKQGEQTVPVGIVTDRDVVVKIVAAEVDASFITVGEIMAPQLASVSGNAGVFETIQYLRSKAVRRLPVVAANGTLLGIVSVDDLLALLADELSALGRLVHDASPVSH